MFEKMYRKPVLIGTAVLSLGGVGATAAAAATHGSSPPAIAHTASTVDTPTAGDTPDTTVDTPTAGDTPDTTVDTPTAGDTPDQAQQTAQHQSAPADAAGETSAPEPGDPSDGSAAG